MNTSEEILEFIRDYLEGNPGKSFGQALVDLEVVQELNEMNSLISSAVLNPSEDTDKEIWERVFKNLFNNWRNESRRI